MRGDKRDEIARLSYLAKSCYAAGDYVKALKYYEVALKSARIAGDKKSVVILLRAMSKVYRAAGKYSQAAACLKEASLIAAGFKGRQRKKAALVFPKMMRVAHGGVPLKKIAAPVDNRNYVVLNVFYATDRSDRGNKNVSRRYGRERAELSYGTCEVSIPFRHRVGELESPSWLRFEFRPNPKKHIVLLNILTQDRDAYFAGLKKIIQDSKKKSAFIYIHGYNNTFEDAARRTAQMAYDLEFSGAPVFYSWPSQGTLKGYMADENTIQWAENHLKGFLNDFAERSAAERIFLIAHSMGNRALVRAFIALMNEKPHLRLRFSELILTAPDIDADVFKNDIAPWAASQQSARVTLYASATDKALEASEKFHDGYPRAGDTGERLVILPGVETIDATNVSTDFWGHVYFARERTVLSDMHYLVNDGLRAAARYGLKAVPTPSGQYWVFKA